MMHAITASSLPAALTTGHSIMEMLRYGFMQHALLAGTVLSMASAPVGHFVLIRHQVFASDALKDVAFTGAMGGAALGLNPLVGLVFLCIAGGLIIATSGQRLAERDIAVGTVLAWILGLGALFLSLFNQHVSGTGRGFSGVTVLFGSILSVSTGQMLVIVLMSAGVLTVLAAIGRPLLFASIAPDVAAARGVPARALDLVFMLVVAMVMAAAVQAVGAMLALALLLLPAAAARRLTTNLMWGILLAVMLALGSVWVGALAGFIFGLPAGASIALTAFAVYVALGVAMTVRTGFRKRARLR